MSPKSVMSTVLVISFFRARISEMLGPKISRSSMCAHTMMSLFRKIDWSAPRVLKPIFARISARKKYHSRADCFSLYRALSNKQTLARYF